MKNSTFFLIVSALFSTYTIFFADGYKVILMGLVAFVCAVASLICQTIEDSAK